MARKRKSSPVDGFIEITSKLPWWAALTLAVVSFFLLHAYVSQSVVASLTPGNVTDLVVPSILKGLATVGQYVLPLLLVIAAGLSAYKTRKSTVSQIPASGLGLRTSSVSGHQSPNCPVCNSAMKLRDAKRGSNAGRSFWGCANYPQCKGTRTAD